MIRTTSPKDEDQIVRLATDSELFEGGQTNELATMLREYHRSRDSTNEIWLVDEHDGDVFSAAYLAAACIDIQANNSQPVG